MSYKLQLLQLAEYIRSFIKLGKLINNLHLYHRTDFDVWKLEFVCPSSFTSPSITDTFDHDPLKLISKCAIGTQDAIITSAGVVQSSPDTSIVPDDDHVDSYAVVGSSPHDDPLNFDKNGGIIPLSFASVTPNRMTASTARSNGTTKSSVSCVPDIKLHHENLDNVFIFEHDNVVDDLFPEEEISFETQPSTAPDTSTIPDNDPVKSSELMGSSPHFHPVGPDDDVLL